MAYDAYFTNVITLLHGNGADGSTTAVDSAGTPKTYSAHGNAQIDTSQSKWGGSSIYFDGSGTSYFDTADSADFDFGTGNFTVEAWVRLETNSATQILFGQSNAAASSYSLVLYNQTFGCFYFYDSSVTPPLATTTVAANTWYFIAICGDNGVARLYLDGVELAATTYTNTAPVASTFSVGRGGEYNAAYFNGWIEDLRITKGVCRYPNGTTFSIPTEQFGDSLPPPDVVGYVNLLSILGAPSVVGHLLYGYAAAAGPLGAANVLGHILYGLCAADGPLGAVQSVAWHDFTGQLDPTSPQFYVMDVTGPDGTLRLPISSWQATLQTSTTSYVQCVVPACADYVTFLADAETFSIYRKSQLLDGRDIYYLMAAAPADVIALNQGPYNYSATLSGYADAFPTSEAPDPALDRTLSGVRSFARTGTSLRVRCAIDWLLRPGHRAYLPDGVESFIVDSISYYVPGSDQYMDLGD